MSHGADYLSTKKQANRQRPITGPRSVRCRRRPMKRSKDNLERSGRPRGLLPSSPVDGAQLDPARHPLDYIPLHGLLQQDAEHDENIVHRSGAGGAAARAGSVCRGSFKSWSIEPGLTDRRFTRKRSFHGSRNRLLASCPERSGPQPRATNRAGRYGSAGRIARRRARVRSRRSDSAATTMLSSGRIRYHKLY